MLVFIDESGIPHPKDDAIRPVVAAVCLPESEHRKIDTQMFSMKKKLLSNTDIEIKAKSFLKPHVYNKMANHRELIESVFDMIRETDGLAIYASINEKPARIPEYSDGHLPIHFVSLLERVHLHLVEKCPPTEMAVIVYDGDGRGGVKGGLSALINAYLIRTKEGIGMPRIITTPFFVNSAITPGIQLADLVAGCIRLYEERDVNKKIRSCQPLASAVNRHYKTIQSKTNNFELPEFGTLYGLRYIPERYLYARGSYVENAK